MKKVTLYFSLFALFIISCKKDRTTSSSVIESNYKLSGNYRPSPTELLTIRENLETLSKLSSSEQKKFNLAKTSIPINKVESINIRKNESISKINTTSEDYDYGSWAAIITNPENDIMSPDVSQYEMQTPIGYNFMYKWVVTYGYFEAFSVISLERCELMYIGALGYPYSINNITHQGSVISGLTGPVSWLENSYSNYFNPGGTYAYLYTAGSLSVLTIGSIFVENHRYTNSSAMSGTFY